MYNTFVGCMLGNGAAIVGASMYWTHRIRRSCDRSRKHIIILAAGICPTRRRSIYIICAYYTIQYTHTHTPSADKNAGKRPVQVREISIIISSSLLL